MQSKKLKKFVAIGMFSSISYILMLLNFPFPGFPPYLNIDFSDIPALLAAIIFGPAAAILVELLKNLLDFVMTGSESGVPIGHIANFLAGITYVLPAYYIYKKVSSKKGLIIGLVVATIFMALFMSVMNYYFILPAYGMFMNMDLGEAIKLVATAIFPFNLIKGVLIMTVFLLLFSKMQPWLTKLSTVK